MVNLISSFFNGSRKVNDGKDAEIAELIQLLKKATPIAEKHLDLVVEVSELKKRLGISDALPRYYQ